MQKDPFESRLTTQKIEEWALKVTRAIGSPASMVIHSVFFLICMILPFFGLDFDRMLLFLTTIVSLEAIYLGILIQFTVNQSQENIKKVEKDIDEIQEDVQEIQEDVGEIQEDIDEIQEDVDEIQEDVDDIEEGEEKDSKRDKVTHEMISAIQNRLEALIGDIEKLKSPAKKTLTIKKHNKKT